MNIVCYKVQFVDVAVDEMDLEDFGPMYCAFFHK